MRKFSNFLLTELYRCLHLPSYHLRLLTIELLMMMHTIFMEPGILWIPVLLIVSYLLGEHFFSSGSVWKIVFCTSKNIQMRKPQLYPIQILHIYWFNKCSILKSVTFHSFFSLYLNLKKNTVFSCIVLC